MWAAGPQWLPDQQLEVLAAGSLVVEGEAVIQREFEQESEQAAWWLLVERWCDSGINLRGVEVWDFRQQRLDVGASFSWGLISINSIGSGSDLDLVSAAFTTTESMGELVPFLVRP